MLLHCQDAFVAVALVSPVLRLWSRSGAPDARFGAVALVSIW